MTAAKFLPGAEAERAQLPVEAHRLTEALASGRSGDTPASGRLASASAAEPLTAALTVPPAGTTVGAHGRAPAHPETCPSAGPDDRPPAVEVGSPAPRLAPAEPSRTRAVRPSATPEPITPQPLSGRAAYRAELTALAAADERILCLEADLGGKGHPFQLAHPERFFNLGIAEGAMVDMAAGLAAGGYKPFVSTFAPFAALRAAESLKLTLGYLNAGVTVVAPYAGVSGAWFGTTHHCLEDLAVLRAVPGVRIAAPYGEAEMRAVIREAARSGRPYYIRTGRDARYESLPGADQLPLVNWESADGDVCLVSVGEEGTRLAVEAREQVPGTAHAHLVHVDHEHLAQAAPELARRHRTFVVVEEHRTQGGAAEALALLLPHCQVTSVAADRSWPSQGGDHAEVMAALGLELPAVTRALEHARSTRHHHSTHTPSRSLSCTS
ncbi:MAG TPA: transketolase [Streptomyces sp.]